MRRIERRILELKGGSFFLPPRDREFLRFLKEEGIPDEVVEEGVSRCLKALEPSERERFPLFLCYRVIVETFEEKRRLEAYRAGFHWRERFYRKLQIARMFVEECPPPPRTEGEALKILREIEDRILKRLWRRLPK